MKKLATLLLLLLAVPSFAQITISGDQYIQYYTGGRLASTTYTSTDVTGLDALIAATGANQNWGFGKRVYTQTIDSSTTTIFAYPGDAPMANDPDLTSATNVGKVVPNNPAQPTMYIFWKVDATGFYTCGSVQDSMGIVTKLLSYNPPSKDMMLPLTYQTTWTSTSAVNSPIFAGFGATAQEVIEGNVDGYGTLNTPQSAHSKDAGPMTADACLRLQKTTSLIISVAGTNITNKSITYQWLTQGSTSAVIVADKSSTPQSVSYSKGAASSVDQFAGTDASAIHIGANPVGTTTSISVTLPNNGQARVMLMDALGRNSMMLLNANAQAGVNALSLDPSQLANGTYFLHVDAPGVNSTQKLIIAH